MSGNHIRTEVEFHKYLRRIKEVRTKKLGYPFIVIDKKNNQIVGSTRLENINFESKRLELDGRGMESSFEEVELIRHVNMNF